METYELNSTGPLLIKRLPVNYIGYILLCILLPLTGFSQNTKLGATKGFEGYLFGTSPGAYKNLMLEIEEGNTQLYSMEQPSISISGIELWYFRLTFTKNKLYDISLQTKNGTGAKLLQILKDSYGAPTRVNQAKRTYEWVSDKLQLLYEGSLSGKDGTVSFSSKKNV